MSYKKYYDIDMDSSSSLKCFDDDRRKYYKKYIEKKIIPEKRNQAIITGNLVDCMLLEPDEFDNLFYLSTVTKIPTGLMLDFVEKLAELSLSNEESFSYNAKEAYNESGYKIKFDAVIKKFAGSDAELYYNELITVAKKGLQIVTLQDIANADKIIYELKTNSTTKDIINQVDCTDFTVYNQLQIIDESKDSYLGIPIKGMIDKIIIDHKNKIIQPYDLKCTWSVEDFVKDYFLYRKSYIQASVYYRLCLYYFEDLITKKYVIKPIKFIVCDSINYTQPLIFETTEVFIKGFKGFTHNGKKYKGVYEIIEELKWAKENNIWNISKTNYDQKGVVSIKI